VSGENVPHGGQNLGTAPVIRRQSREEHFFSMRDGLFQGFRPCRLDMPRLRNQLELLLPDFSWVSTLF
jgi:hypothetical protein